MQRNYASQPRRTQPGGWSRIDTNNKFGALVRLAVYPITPKTLYFVAVQPEIKPTVTNVIAQTDVALGQPLSNGAIGARRAGSGIWSSRTYPAGLNTTNKMAIVLMLQGRSESWDTTTNSSNRLFDTSSGAHWRVSVERNGASSVAIKIASFAGISLGVSYSCDPRMPLVVGMTNRGSNTQSSYAKGWLQSAQLVSSGYTQTQDSAGAGTDCRFDFGGSGASDVDYALGLWLTEKPDGNPLSDAEMCELMENPWQVFTPDVRRVHAVAAAATFMAAWAANANAVMSSGARAA